eukprot:TRINITY_DN4850_c0_g1_i1.p1 TRINITY_DN4850_c0_g1~~TRINITY_DN4850_c0_g1_i1.p1  ORF type:complete len:596 (-),score=173.47 TRINITY_DN4850_c0_g1_i1:111-1811(-)
MPLFAGVDERLVSGFFVLKSLKAGQFVFREGQDPDGFYIVHVGRLGVSATKGEQHEEVFLGNLNPGDWFGEIALIEKQVRSATVRVEVDAVLLFADKDNFGRLLKYMPQIRGDSFNRVMQARTANSLKAIPFFNFLRKKTFGPLEVYDAKRLSLLGNFFSFVSYPASKTVFAQGEASTGLYLIVNGKVRVTSEQTVEREAVVTHTTRGAVTTTGSLPKLTSEEILLNTLGVGDLFGELSLLEKTFRTATVTTTEDCIFLHLSGKDWETFLELAPEIVEKVEILRQTRTANSLSKIPLFSDVIENKPWSKLSMLGGLFVYVQVLASEELFKQGDDADMFYVIVHGTVSVVSSNESGGEVVLGSLKAGDWFGEIALLADVRRTATVRASDAGPCLLLALTKAKFSQFLRIAPEIRNRFNMLVMQRTANTLRSIPIFKEVKESKPWSKLDLLGSLFVYESFEKGESVLRKGDDAAKFYFVVQGELEAFTQVNGNKVVLEKMTANSWFGEIALLEESGKVTASVDAVSHCLLLSITAEQFHKFLEIASELKSVLHEVAARRRSRTGELGA